MKAQNKDFVVLLHGILRSPFDMLPLTLYLKNSGYDTANILYPSRRKSLEDLTAFVAEKIAAHPAYDPGKTIHFVTHSMGSLIARYYIATRRPAHLGKVVMLGPPNTGSEFADYLDNHKILNGFYKSFYGPAGQQLKTSYRHIDQPVDYPLGVIAGTRSINPLAVLALKGAGAHDGIVPVARTRLEGMTEHIVLPTTHTFMMFSPRVMREVGNFLKEGKFGI